MRCFISEHHNGIEFWLCLCHATGKPFVCTLTPTRGQIQVMSTMWSTNHNGENPCENIPSNCFPARCLKCVWNVIKAFENKILTTEVQQVCCVIDSLDELAASIFRYGVGWESVWVIGNLSLRPVGAPFIGSQRRCLNLWMGDHTEIFLCELLCGLCGARQQGWLSNFAVDCFCWPRLWY